MADGEAPPLTLREEDMPALYAAANQRSIDTQRHFITATKWRLLALMAAAAAGALSGELEPPDWIAFVAVVAFLVAVGIEIYLYQARPEREWYEARAAAESAKSLAWRFGVGGEPLGVSVADASSLYQNRLGDILKDLDIGLASSAQPGEQITEAMSNLRAAPPDARRYAYRQDRIEDQRDWYHKKALENSELAETRRKQAIGLEILGVVAGVLTFAGVVKIDLLGVFAAGVASIVAWLQTRQHETLATSYAVTEQELAGVRSEWDVVGPAEDDWAAFVDKAEEAISREHKLWRASRGVAARWDRRAP
jgi:hypothetical protein